MNPHLSLDVPEWHTCQRNSRRVYWQDLTEPGLNQGTPRYTALSGDDYLDAGDDLHELLDELADTAGDVAVWDSHRGTLAAVIRRHQVTVFEAVPANGPLPVPKPQTSGRRPEVLGHSLCGVLAWMGGQGWTGPEARAVLSRLGVGRVSNNTLTAALSAGRHSRTKVAALAPDDAAQLRRLRFEVARDG
jgi:hypothetical protein